MSRRTIQDGILYIACDEQPNAMKAFLKADGYARCSRSRAEEKSLELIQYRSSEADDPQYRLSLYKKIDANGETSEVMMWKDSTPVSTLLFRGARTTADLHILSWDKAHSLYPQRTMLAKEAYMLNKMDEETCEELSENLKSLSEDRIDVKGVHWSTKHDEAAIPENLTPRLRHIGDKFTWTLEFNTEGVVVTSFVPNKVLESSTFRIVCRSAHHVPGQFDTTQ
jgi:hypothetical protein